jgi:autotransporter strand-loop-strand O-heptosyltransferase
MEKVSVSFVSNLPKLGDSPKVKISNTEQVNYYVEFINSLTNEVISSIDCSSNQVVCSGKQWCIDWLVKVYRKGEESPFFIEKFNPKGKTVFIKFDARALGDCIAWIPYVEEFRKKWDCHLICSTFHNSLFIEQYPNILFVEPNTKIENVFAQYYVGAHDSDNVYSPIDNKRVPLQMVASHLLNLPWKEIRPELDPLFLNTKRPIKEKYVCISEFASSEKKQWKEVGGWQKMVDFLISKGYYVLVLSKEKSNLNNVIDLSGKNIPIKEIAYYLYHADFFMGVSSGLSWLSWAVNTKTILISDCTPIWHEFNDNVLRISANPNLTVVDYEQTNYSRFGEVIDKIGYLF